MKIKSPYKIFWLPVVLMLATACNINQKKLNRRVTLWRKDKIPYGTYYAYEGMKYIFPDAYIHTNSKSPQSFSEQQNYTGQTATNNRRKAYIIIAPQVLPDRSETNALMNFVSQGNQLFISSFNIGDSLLAYLKINVIAFHNFFTDTEFLRLSVYSPVTYDSLSFQYPGLAADNFVNSMDTPYTTILGRDAAGRADFVRFTYKGGGAIYLHFAPMAFTNFFLLYKNNKAYYDNVFSYLPTSVNEIIWDDYFRYANRSNFSALQYIFSNKSLRWAFWLMLLLFLVIYVFESRRRQRLVPVVQPPANSSLDFVKTVGRLYYHRKDNSNLVSKMTTHFLDYIRSRYNIPTSVLDDQFTDRLAYKSGYNKEELKSLIYDIKTLHESPALSDEALLALNKKMEAFYKHA